MWKRAEVKMVFEERLCGSVPLNKEIVSSWLEARMPKEKPENGKSLEEIKKELLASIEDVEEKVSLGFQKLDDEFVIRGATIKAHLKDCANQVKDVVIPSIKAFRSKVANKIYIEEYWVKILKEASPVKTVDGEFDQPVHVMTAMGPRNALKKIQYISKPTLAFTVRLMKDKELTPKVIENVFAYGSIHGYGGERGMGEGRYSYAIVWLDDEE